MGLYAGQHGHIFSILCAGLGHVELPLQLESMGSLLTASVFTGVSSEGSQNQFSSPVLAHAEATSIPLPHLARQRRCGEAIPTPCLLSHSFLLQTLATTNRTVNVVSLCATSHLEVTVQQLRSRSAFAFVACGQGEGHPGSGKAVCGKEGPTG